MASHIAPKADNNRVTGWERKISRVASPNEDEALARLPVGHNRYEVALSDFTQKPVHECWVTCKRGRSFKKPTYGEGCDMDKAGPYG
ncbi:hypothetical protein MSG28_011935 [Choristoneura fumiferana]|uniref:Uncharacterized protein n=1 Tax=Choristoneura fumiferana TaxID=7141 RepID=A0ACC0KN39_CHOFU|nr:hypothetical protein MSG28_011935 [Choristoneura fumiferana]